MVLTQLIGSMMTWELVVTLKMTLLPVETLRYQDVEAKPPSPRQNPHLVLDRVGCRRPPHQSQVAPQLRHPRRLQSQVTQRCPWPAFPLLELCVASALVVLW